MRWLRTLLMVAIASLVTSCASRPAVWVFTAPWDARSEAALAAGTVADATVISGWIALDSLGGLPAQLFVDTLGSATARAAARFALVTSYHGDRFHPEAVRELAADATARARAVERIATMLRAGRYTGVVFDFEALSAADTAALGIVTGDLARAACGAGIHEVAIAVPALDLESYPPAMLLAHVDRVVVMLYDLHWMGSAPGPVAARAWARDALGRWVAAAGAERVVAALPTYGYRWRTDQPTDVVGWADVQQLAQTAGRTPQRDTASGALRLQLAPDDEAWLADAPLVAAMAADAKALGVRRLALWRLGLEDPAIWPAVRQR